MKNVKKKMMELSVCGESFESLIKQLKARRF